MIMGFFNSLVIFLINPALMAILKTPFQKRIRRATFKKILKASVAESTITVPSLSIEPDQKTNYNTNY